MNSEFCKCLTDAFRIRQNVGKLLIAEAWERACALCAAKLPQAAAGNIEYS